MTLTTLSTTYEARTAAGALIATFQHSDQAGAWAEEHAHEWPGVRLEVVKTRVTRSVLFGDLERAA